MVAVLLIENLLCISVAVWLRASPVSTMDQHGRAALDFTNDSSREQLVSGSTHVSGNCLDIVSSLVPEEVQAFSSCYLKPFCCCRYLRTDLPVPIICLSKIFLNSKKYKAHSTGHWEYHLDHHIPIYLSI